MTAANFYCEQVRQQLGVAALLPVDYVLVQLLTRRSRPDSEPQG